MDKNEKHQISEHLHKNFQTTTNLKSSNTCINGFEVSESGIEEMQAREVNVLHFVKVDHTFFDFFIPCHPSLFLFIEFFYHLFTFNWVVFSVHGNEVSIKWDGLNK